jgi:hypothetical protein
MGGASSGSHSEEGAGAKHKRTFTSLRTREPGGRVWPSILGFLTTDWRLLGHSATSLVIFVVSMVLIFNMVIRDPAAVVIRSLQ